MLKLNRRSIRHRWSHIQASLRDTVILFREFRTPLIWFSIAIIGGGFLYYYISIQVHETISGVIEAIYIVLIATFLQPANREFPQHFALQIFHFLMPIVGLVVLAQGLADFGILLFNRNSRNKEWEMAVASTLKNHIILIGLGHLGFRATLKLHEMGEQVVVIELNANADTLAAVRELGIPVIPDDASRPNALQSANITEAKTVVLASQNDSLNLQIALKARSLNPGIRVVLRIFDDEFAHALQDQFGFHALSATEMAAPVFAATAAGMDVTNPISVEGQFLSLARFTISEKSRFVRKNVGYVEDNYHLNIVLLRHANVSEMHPTDRSPLHAGDVIVTLGGPEELQILLNDNEGR